MATAKRGASKRKTTAAKAKRPGPKKPLPKTVRRVVAGGASAREVGKAFADGVASAHASMRQKQPARTITVDFEDDDDADDESNEPWKRKEAKRKKREENVGLAERAFSPQAPTDISARECCTCPCESLARKFAEHLAQPEANQQGACFALGLNYRTHMRWMANEEMPDYPDLWKYQSIVGQALDQQRRADLLGMQRRLNHTNVMRAASQLNLDKFAHENRFRRFYGDEERKRVELSGPDGEALPSTQVQYVVSVPEDEPEEPSGPTN